ncbi:hypothetical protein DERF_014670 [Dermatophagoides farinae]|uniref:Uncharacterized protein n=1 Tax=Dermatophagoides farinae TaxID=6954 RepID=A0A922KUT8_DERFA|nr:hypothetical protein DERF_014670 [Dermatophagoides farinae]
MNINHRSKMNSFKLHHLIRMLNYPFRMAIPLFPPIIINRITLMKINRLVQNSQVKRFSSLNFLFVFTLFTSSFIRAGSMCLFRNDQHIITTITGSIFHLLHTNRLHPEMVAFHFGAEQCLYLALIFSSEKYYHFFRLLISYCHQIYDPFMSIEDNKKRRLQIFHLEIYERHLNFVRSLGLHSSSIDLISRKIRHEFRMQAIVLISVPITLFCMATIFLYSIDPYRNNFWLFNYSYFWYSFYNFNLAFFTAIWAYYGLVYTTNLFAYFRIICSILIEKSKLNQKLLERFQPRSRKLMIMPFRRHLYHQSKLYCEIRMINEFWSKYLSFTFLVYISLFCNALYVTIMTDTLMSLKIFFFTFTIQSMLVVSILTIIAATLFKHNYFIHKKYYSLMGKHFDCIDLSTKFKMTQTLDLINSHIVGFTLMDGKIIQNDTILFILLQTITMFILVTRMV